MKTLNILLLAVLAFMTTKSFAYVSQVGDPQNGQYESEYKGAVKSTVASYSDAISKGHALYLSENELATGAAVVSRFYSGTANTDNAYQSCIAKRDVATGDIAGFPCVTRGYVDYARAAAGLNDSNTPILPGTFLCIGTAASSKGYLIPCASGTSKFIALTTLTNGLSTTFKVLVRY